jgi:hypothetical protein
MDDLRAKLQAMERALVEPSLGERECFLCNKGFYRAVNGKARECPMCTSGVLPPFKETYNESEWSSWLC